MKKKFLSKVFGYLIVGCLASASVASAFGETNPTDVRITEFSLLDTASDVVGSADFTPEGNKDGHFKLSLNLTKQTVINAFVLRSTDAYGKDNYQGVWRTNRVTTGWLLGIKQGSDIINPGFRKDVKEPVGTFEGQLNWDLYASNNGTIKETQYYVLEIETSDGTLVSRPIRYGAPMKDSQQPAPSTPPATTPSPTPPAPVPTPTPTPPANKSPKITGAAALVQVENAKPHSVLTLIDKSNSTITNYGSLEVDNNGTAMWNQLPIGNDYYVYDEAGNAWGPVSVARYAVYGNVFVNDSIVLTSKYSQEYIAVTIEGEVIDSSTDQVIVQVGLERETVPVKDKHFSFNKSFPYKDMAKIISISGNARSVSHSPRNSPNILEVIYLRADHDLVEDTSVIGKEESKGNWQIKGNFTSSYKPNNPNYPLIRAEAQPTDWEILEDIRLRKAPSFEDLERKLFYRDFQVKHVANKSMKEISLVLLDSAGGFEILHLWPSSATVSTKKLLLQLESTSASANGIEATLEAAPYIFEGRTVVPLRFIAEALGATITWNAETRKVTLKTAADQIELVIDQKEAIVNGKASVLDAPATIKGGVTMVPVRFVSENLRMNVFFSDGSILITDLPDPGYPYTQTGKQQN